MALPRANVYIDGFNLYYGALKGGANKWLDLRAIAQRLMPGYRVQMITYCTARVIPRDDNAHVHVRQDVYLRAIQAVCRPIEILEGKYKLRSVRGVRKKAEPCGCCNGGSSPCHCCSEEMVSISKPEEKGSDVNLAVRLVRDAFQDRYDAALVISDDSDLQLAIDVAMADCGKKIVVCDPRGRKNHSLNGSERRIIRAKALADCQLPVVVVDQGGREISKPARW